MTLFALHLPHGEHFPADEQVDKQIVEILMKQAQEALALDDRKRAAMLLSVVVKALDQ